MKWIDSLVLLLVSILFVITYYVDSKTLNIIALILTLMALIYSVTRLILMHKKK